MFEEVVTLRGSVEGEDERRSSDFEIIMMVFSLLIIRLYEIVWVKVLCYANFVR